MDNLVSIIIPVFNAEKYIVETLNSIFNQTYPFIEIIVVNDGSTDRTLAILETIKRRDLKIFTQQNKGASAAKQLGVEQSTGKFIQYLDADDLLSENKIQIQVEALLNSPNKIAVCSTVHFNDFDNYHELTPSSYEDSFLFDSDNPAEFLINLYGGYNNSGSMIQPNAFLTPIEIIKSIGTWNLEISPCKDEDSEYFCRAILASNGVKYTKGALNYYRKFPKKNSLSALKNQQSSTNLFHSILSKRYNLFKLNDGKNAKLAIAKQLISLAVECYPTSRKLAFEIIKEVELMGSYKFTPISGGPIIQKLSELVGWKQARQLQYFIRKK